jgi:hypothetical protein
MDTIRTLMRAATVFAPVGLAAWLFRSSKQVALRRAFACLLIAGSLFYAVSSSYFIKSNFLYASALIAVGCSIFYLRKHGDAALHRPIEFALGVAFLAIMPFALSAGTDNELFWHASVNIAPLVLAALAGPECLR